MFFRWGSDQTVVESGVAVQPLLEEPWCKLMRRRGGGEGEGEGEEEGEGRGRN